MYVYMNYIFIGNFSTVHIYYTYTYALDTYVYIWTIYIDTYSIYMNNICIHDKKYINGRIYIENKHIYSVHSTAPCLFS